MKLDIAILVFAEEISGVFDVGGKAIDRDGNAVFFIDENLRQSIGIDSAFAV